MSSPKKLPIGVQTLRNLIEGGYYYVDKTALACQLIEGGKYYFLSRPRRFGKSLFLDTLKSIFAGEKELFTGLAAESRIDWSQTFPIIRINFALAPENSLDAWRAVCLQQLQTVADEYELVCNASHPGLRLTELIGKLHRKTGRKVVVLVDEYDKPILDSLENSELARTMRDFLAGFYSSLKSEDEHLHFVMLSGVSKFSKVSLFSGLNHLNDISLNARYSSICGYTEPELISVFADRLSAFSLDEIRRWYNGYNWLGEAVYNPWSLLNLFENQDFRGYWWESGKPSFLLKLLQRKKVFVPHLSAFHTDADLLGKFDVDDISPDALLFQAGYLTIRQVEKLERGNRYTLGYPNLEVEKYLNAGLFATLSGSKGAKFSELGQAIGGLDWQQACAMMHAQFAAIPYHYHTQNPMAEKEGWYASLFFSMLGALGFHIIGEDVTNHGRIDLTLMLPQAICLFEFKVGKLGKAPDTAAALGQILARDYAQKYAADGRPVLAIGVTFAPDARNIVSFAVRGADGVVREWLASTSGAPALLPDAVALAQPTSKSALPPSLPQASSNPADVSARKNPAGINLLHLTDLHFGWDGSDVTQAAQRKLCLDGLLTVLRALPQHDKPDLVLISGDIAWRGAASDYVTAQAWLTELAEACDVGMSHIVAAPGNHDSVRKQARQFGVPEDASEADEMLQPPLGEMMRRTVFAPFTDFAEKAGLPPLALGAETTRLAGMVTLTGVRVVVLNSAWCARGDDDKNQLWLGLPQLQVMQAKGQLDEIAQGAPLTVAVMHHPFDWLHEAENQATTVVSGARPSTKDWLALRCHLLLTGHTHAEIREPDQIARGCMHFAAGASYAGSGHFNSFRLLQIAGNQCRYRTWEFDPRKAKKPWTEQQSDSITLPYLGKAEPPPSAPMVAGQSTGQAGASVKEDVSRLLAYVPRQLLGREGELAHLRAAWARVGGQVGASAPPILAIIALGGEGKTSLLCTWMLELQAAGWQGAQAVFAWSFYSQGSSEQSASSSDIFLDAALRFFGETTLADSNTGAYEKGQHLARCCARQRTLLLLDGVEPLQYAPTSPNRGELKDQGMLGLLRGLGTQAGGSLCVLTSRYALPQIASICQQIVLPRLPMEAAVALLRRACPIGADADYAQAVEQVKGHALALHIMAEYVKEAHGGDIRQRDLLDWQHADDEETHGHAFRAMAAYGAWLAQDLSPHSARALALLHVLALFDRPAERHLVHALFVANPANPIPARLHALQGLSEADWNICIKRLESASMLTRTPQQGQWQSLDAHPLLREYFARHWREQDEAGFQAAHGCLFEFLQANTQEGKTPSLGDLLPLYQAVAHGCWAGQAEVARAKVYRDRILRGKEGYSIYKLGAHAQNLAAVACFFNPPWQQVLAGISTAAQAELLSNAAFNLSALGRLQEALQPMQVALGMFVAQQDWNNAAAQASNLAQMQLLLGQITAACGSAQQGLDYAEQSGVAFRRMVNRSTFAEALHQSGQVAQALALMIEAERIQVEDQPEYPLLYAVAGFWYCEILLASQSASAQQVADLVRKTLAWMIRQNWLLFIALDHLTLARCALLQGLPSAQAEAEQAVAGLRQSSNSDFLPRALLTRATVHCQIAPNPAKLQAAIIDLNECFDLCQRGPMPLFMADTLLTRVRLFAPLAQLDANPGQPYPWQSPQADLLEARRIIDECGYERRRAELEELTIRFP